MEVPEVVEMKDIRRNWWIVYNWKAEPANESWVYHRMGLRRIEEAKEAAEQFDIFLKNFKSCTFEE